MKLFGAGGLKKPPKSHQNRRIQILSGGLASFFLFFLSIFFPISFYLVFFVLFLWFLHVFFCFFFFLNSFSEFLLVLYGLLAFSDLFFLFFVCFLVPRPPLRIASSSPPTGDFQGVWGAKVRVTRQPTSNARHTAGGRKSRRGREPPTPPSGMVKHGEAFLKVR